MADPKAIHEFTSGEGELGSLFLMDRPDQQASSGYTTEKLAMTDLGDFLNNEMDYTQDLSTENKKVIGALNELHGVDGYDVYDETRTSSNKYVQGDICIHSNSLQVCTDANGAYGAWDSSKWSPTTIKALLALKQNATDNSLTTTAKQIVPAINEIKTALTNMNIESVTRVATTVTTGNTGNIALPYDNDGYTYIVGALCTTSAYVPVVWVSSVTNSWFITIRGAETWTVAANQQVNIRYLVVKIKSM